MTESTQEVETITETETQVVEEVGSDGEKFDAARAQALITKLREEAKESKKAEKELATLRAADEERKQADLSELEKANKRAEELETKLKATELREMRTRIGAEAKLPEELAKLLQGDDEEAMKAHAKKLFAALPKTASITATNAATSDGTMTDAQRRAFMNGGQLP